MHRRKLSAWFYMWVLLVGAPLGLALGFATAHGVGAWTTDMPLREGEDFSNYLERSAELQGQRQAFERRLALLTVPLGCALIASLLGRLALRRTIVSVTEDAVYIARIIGTRRRAKPEVASVTKSDVFHLMVSEPIYVVQFCDGGRAFIRPVFVSNAAILAQALTSSPQSASSDVAQRSVVSG